MRPDMCVLSSRVPESGSAASSMSPEHALRRGQPLLQVGDDGGELAYAGRRSSIVAAMKLTKLPTVNVPAARPVCA